MPIEKQVVILYAATRGHLDKRPVSTVPAFEQAVLDHIDGSLLKEIRDSGFISPALEKRLDDFFKTLLINN